MQDDSTPYMGLPLYRVVFSCPRMTRYHPAVLNSCDHPEGWLAILYEVAGDLDSVLGFDLCASVSYPFVFDRSPDRAFPCSGRCSHLLVTFSIRQ
jgi:hypothetical protein